jgi:hypothetical protein
LIFFNWLNLFWHTDKNFCFYAEVNFWDFVIVRNDNSNKGTTARLNETRFGPNKRSSPIYLGSKILNSLMHWMSVNLPDNFQMREHSWPCWFHINIWPILLLLSLISKGKNPSCWCCVIECRYFTNCETLCTN